MPYEVKIGISIKNIKQLLKYSKNDPLIDKFTNDKERFGDIHSFKRWLSKGRIIYTLIDKESDLKGIIWFGKKSIPEKVFIRDFVNSDYGITFAVRIYGEVRGMGYGMEFMNKAFLKFYKNSFFRKAKHQGIWLEVSYDNINAVNLYKKFGFKKASKVGESGKIIMIYPKATGPKLTKI